MSVKEILESIAGLMVLVFLGWLFFGGSDDPEPELVLTPKEAEEIRIAEGEAVRNAEEAAAQEAETLDRLLSQMAMFKTDPCSTDLYLIDAFGWMITCENCAAVPASRIHSSIIDSAEQWAVNGRITLTDLLEIHGKCP